VSSTRYGHGLAGFTQRWMRDNSSAPRPPDNAQAWPCVHCGKPKSEHRRFTTGDALFCDETMQPAQYEPAPGEGSR
jgi:hypothetical protein